MGMHLLPTREGTPACSICPAGFACHGGKQTPCSLGTYAPVGSGVCLPCPKDAVCTDPAKSPTRCPFGWQRKGDSPNCSPCPAGTMCNSLSRSASRAVKNVECPHGTYTDPSSPGMCIPCPPGFLCPTPFEKPQRCPVGTHSLGAARNCFPAPAGLVVLEGKEHLPPQPCEEGLVPIKMDGRWWCGIDYEDEDAVNLRTSNVFQTSPANSQANIRPSTFIDTCRSEEMDHRNCTGGQVPQKGMCTLYGQGPNLSFPSDLRDQYYIPLGGSFSEFFANCGYYGAFVHDETSNVRFHTSKRLEPQTYHGR